MVYLKKDDYKFYLPNKKEYFTYVTFDDKWANGIKRNEIIEAIMEKMECQVFSIEDLIKKM